MSEDPVYGNCYQDPRSTLSRKSEPYSGCFRDGWSEAQEVLRPCTAKTQRYQRPQLEPWGAAFGQKDDNSSCAGHTVWSHQLELMTKCNEVRWKSLTASSRPRSAFHPHAYLPHQTCGELQFSSSRAGHLMVPTVFRRKHHTVDQKHPTMGKEASSQLQRSRRPGYGSKKRFADRRPLFYYS